MSNEALSIANIPFSVTSQINRAPHWTMIRELTMNAIEAAAKAQGEKIVHWTTTSYRGFRKAVIWNTGPGLNAAELKAATYLACEVGKNLGLDENFGVGAKVSSLGSNKLGMRFRSCKTNGQRQRPGSAFHLARRNCAFTSNWMMMRRAPASTEND
jgi:hypothetical protein